MSEKRIEHVGVSAGYTHWAKDYDGYENPLIAVEEPVVRRLILPLAGRHVLDAGCGTGRHTAWMCSRGAEVIGVDENESMLAIARTKCPGAELIRGSVLELDALFPTRKFDLVLNALMAEHVRDLDRLFASIASVLAPEGTLVFSVWHPAMIEKGVPTHYEDEAAGVEYVLPTFPHEVSDYEAALGASGLSLESRIEPSADEALVKLMPHMQKHAGWPLALVLRAVAKGAR